LRVVAQVILGCLVWASFLALVARPALGAPESPFIAVSEVARPAVVNIRCIRSVTDEGVGTAPLQEMFRQFFPDEAGKGGRFEMPSTGSGFVIDPVGDILTNYHVIDRAEEIFVRFSGEKIEYRATIVGTDPNTDLALIRIQPDGRRLPSLEFADSDAVQVGAWAIAVGNPFGNLESSLTVGVVSAKGRGDLVIGGLTPRYQDFIQTDASINFGNSGGPLVDVDGRVIGVNTAINEKGQGIGFAVPSNLVREIYGQLREHGRVIRGFLGVATEDLVLIAGETRPDDPTAGVRVVSVSGGHPGDLAGMLAGDIIVSFDGEQVDSRRQFQFRVARAAVGTEVNCGIIREGVRMDLRVTPVEWIQQESAAAQKAPVWLGMEVASADGSDPRAARLKEVLGVTATTGVMVVSVVDGQPASDAGIRPGDVIVSIDGQEITDLDDYVQVRDLMAARREALTVLVRTGALENYVSVVPRSGGVQN